MITAIIIDDEPHCIDRLCMLLAQHWKHTVHFMGGFQTVEDGLNAIHKLRPELVFLDVQLYDKTCFDLLQSLNEITFEVIFTTAYEKYAVQAFKFSAIDYLLKPVDPDDLQQAIERLKEKKSTDERAAMFNALFQNLQGHSIKISVPTMSGLTFLQVTDIIRCQSDINYTTIFLKDKQKLVVSKTLKEFEELLTEYNFYRVHNSHLINLAYIKSYNKSGFVTMTDNSSIEVSTRRKNEFLKKVSTL